MRDPHEMTAEEAADVLAATFTAARAKQAFDLNSLKSMLGNAGSAVGNAASSAASTAKPYLQEAWNNPYIRNSLLAAGGGAALGAGRNMSLSPEERRRRSLMGDMLTGATLGGVAGAGGTMLSQLGPGLGDPSKEVQKQTQEQAATLAAGQAPGAGIQDRFNALPLASAGQMLPMAFPSPVSGAAGAVLGGLGGHGANVALDKFLAPGAIRGADRETLTSALKDKTGLIDKILNDKSPARNIGERLKNWNQPATALGVPTPEQLTQQLAGGRSNVSLQDIEVPLQAQMMQAREMQAQQGPAYGVENKPHIESTAKALDDLEKQKKFVGANSMSQQEAHTMGNGLRNRGGSRTGQFMRHGLMPAIGVAGGFALGSQNPVGPSFPTVFEHAHRLFNGAAGAVGNAQHAMGEDFGTSPGIFGGAPAQAQGLPHWNPSAHAEGLDALKQRASVF